MNLAEYWSGAWAGPLPAAVVNHLWQSTLVAGVAWLLAVALRKNHARTRYWIWMTASVKFLVPFMVLMDLGTWLRALIPISPARSAVAGAMEQVAQPFGSIQALQPGTLRVAAQHASLSPMLLLVLWVCGALVVAIPFGWGWCKVYAAKRNAWPLDVPAEARTLQRLGADADLPVLCSPALIEPGIFGIFRPVLLMPKGILERLEPEQLRAIVAHEMDHVRRRDNLTFALHMIVEIVFWFFPLVWWIGARLIEERERACDEAVLSAGGKAQVYAEGILNVCKFCVEAPVACTAGVTGSDLKKRIVRILSDHVVHGLDLRRKVLLGAAAALAVALPLGAGLMRAVEAGAQVRAEDELADLPKFDVASIKPHKDEGGGRMMAGIQLSADGVNVSGVPLRMILRQAFGVSDDRILNEPDWVSSNRYDIAAKVAPDDIPKLKAVAPEERGIMMLSVLEDRCGLKFHRETREMKVYTLVVVKGGPKLKEAQPNQPGADMPIAMLPGMDGAAVGQMAVKPGADGGGAGPITQKGDRGAPPGGPRMMMRISPQGMTAEAHGATTETIVRMLSMQLGSTVVDQTGLTGKYDYTLSWMPDMSMGSMMKPLGAGPPPGGGSKPGDGPAPAGGPDSPPADAGPSLFTALQEQLGLKLVEQKAPVDVIVIDHIEPPSAN